MHHNAASTCSEQLHDNGVFTTTTKKKRRPAGTPDPEAEVVSLSPKTLLESDRYVCEICNQGFQRDQNLQMHRRRHKVPWQLLKRSSSSSETDQIGGGNSSSKTMMVKKVYVCPEPSCLHHDPRHALGDLVGIKKHFRRKHSTHKQWVCDKCSKAYAVQSDYKAHLKTCGTRGHSCDCGRVFSRVESFIEHQDVCTVRQLNQSDEQEHEQQQLGGPVKRSGNSSRTESSSSASTEPNHHVMKPPVAADPIMAAFMAKNNNQDELLLSSSQQNLLDLSIGLGLGGGRGGENDNYSNNTGRSGSGGEEGAAGIRLREYANEQLRVAAAEKAYAEEARQQARRQVEVAELEFANAQRMRLQAQAELERAHLLKQHALTRINSTLTHITCPTCKLHFTYHHPPPPTLPPLPPSTDDSSSLAISYMSSPTTDGDGDGDGDGE